MDIDDASDADIPILQEIYTERILSEDLLWSMQTDTSARREFAVRGGFLSDDGPDLDFIARYLHPVGTIKVARDEQTVTGFFSIMTDPELVAEQCQHEYGVDRNVNYASESRLPCESEAGCLEWGDAALAMNILNSPNRIALAGLLAVRGAQPPWLPYNLAKTACNSLTGDWLLAQIYEITSVDGQSVEPPVTNEASLGIARALHGQVIGRLLKEVRHADGITVGVSALILAVPTCV